MYISVTHVFVEKPSGRGGAIRRPSGGGRMARKPSDFGGGIGHQAVEER